MAEIVRRRSWGGVLPLGRHASISGSRSIHAPSVSIALSSFQEGQNARLHNRFKLEQALRRRTAYWRKAVVGPGPGRQTNGRESWVAAEPKILAWGPAEGALVTKARGARGSGRLGAAAQDQPEALGLHGGREVRRPSRAV